MATDTNSTNGQRTGQQAGDGGQSARGSAGGASGTSSAAGTSGTSGMGGTGGTSNASGRSGPSGMSPGRGQSIAGREREQAVAGGRRGSLSPSFGEYEQSPFASLWQISREMDRLMDAFFGGGLAAGRSGIAPASDSRYVRPLWTPQIEVRQRENELVIHVDLPGIKQEDIQIEATEDGIAISGERSEQREEGEQGHRHSERTYGSFYRLIPLPEGARIDGAKASMHNGVLEVIVPVERAQRRRIQIEGGQARA